MHNLSGIVERVIFHNEENGFTVLRVKLKEQHELVTVVGHAAGVNPGEFIDASGAWVVDREHGPQLKADEIRITPPTTAEGIAKYLGSGLIKGIGPVYAERLVRAFGDQVFNVIENQPQRLNEVEGIGEKRRELILKAWEGQKVIHDIMVFLHSHGVGTAKAVRIYKTYGAGAIDKVRANPYRLANEIHGIGFLSADKIASHLGIHPHSSLRAEAGLAYILRELSADGHCAFPRGRLLEEADKLLNIPPAILDKALEAEIEAGTLAPNYIDGELCIYLTPLHYAECRVAEALKQLQSGPHPLAGLPIADLHGPVEKQLGFELSASQRRALETALRNRVSIITGGPGVGKTTLLKCLYWVLSSYGLKCHLCAPTGRAARRLSEATGAEAKTIHRLLEFNPGRGQFNYHHDKPLPGDVVILDEASMVDLVLMHQLVRALPARASFIIVGDVDQLPSVGPGQVLRDLIDSGAFPVVRLTEIFRQASQSRIILNAHRVNQGEMILPSQDAERLSDFYFIQAEEPEDILAKMRKVIGSRIPSRFRLDPRRDVQVLTPMYRSQLGAHALNVFLQSFLNPPGSPEVSKFGSTFRAGDKVMQTENNYDKEVFNGDLGFIQEVDDLEQAVTIDFDGRRVVYDFGELDEISPAYACTIHKSQGSEYPAVVIPLHTQHYLMLQRNVLYTAISRARKLVVIIGSRKALSLAITRAEQRRRISGLKDRLARRAPAAAPAAAVSAQQEGDFKPEP